MVLKDDWDTGDSFTHSDANAVAAQVNQNTTDISGKAASSHTHTASAISDSTTVGRNVLTAADAAAARSAIGAGTSSLALGTTNSTAKAGDYAPASTDISDSTSTGRAVLTAASQAAARSAIGAGTGSGDVTGQASSVDSEVALFSGTGGKTIKRATGSGLAKLTSGVLGTATAGTDYYAPSGTDVAVADGGTGSSTASGARTNLGLVIGTDVAADNAVVKLTGNQNIAGTKTFTDASTNVKQLYIKPDSGSAQFYLDNNVGDQWIIANDSSGTFKLYNVANNRSPIVVEDGAPGECLYLDASVVSTVLPLDMTSHKVTNLANGSASGDAVNKGQLDASLVGVAVNSTTSNATPALDATKTDTVLTAQSAAITAFSLSGTFVHGQKHMIQIKDNGTTRAITWTSSVIVAADNITLPTATTVGKTHLIGTRYDSVVGKLIAIAVGSY